MPNPRRLCALAFALLPLALAARAHAAPPPLDESAVAATVNGAPITVGQWIQRMKAVTANDFASARIGNAPAVGLTAGQLALDLLINEQVVLQYAAKVGMMPAAAEVDAAVKEEKARPGFTTTLTDDQLRDAARYQRALYNFATTNQSVSPEEVRAFYVANFGERFQLAMIRTTSKADADAAEAALGKGTSFADMAARYSQDPASKANGGALRGADGQPQWFRPAGSGLPPFVTQAVQPLKKAGDHSPVVTANGADGKATYFIFELLSRYTPTDAEFAKLKPQLERQALFAKAVRSGAAEQKLQEARKAATIVVNLPEYAGLSSPKK